MNKFWSFVLLFILLSPFITKGQEEDAQLWTSVTIEKKINKKITFSIREEFRFIENISEIGSFFTEVSGEYQFNKMFSTSIGYRFIEKKNLDDTHSARNRFLADLTIKKKFDNLGMAFKIKYQSQYNDYYSSEDGNIPINYLRLKLAFKYDLNKKYKPFVSGEAFYYLNSPEGFLFNNYRLTAGINYDFSKKSSLDLSYIYNKEINLPNPLTAYIISIGWTYSL